MQRIINVVSACTFVLALANTAVIVVAFTRGPSIVKKQLSELKLELTQTILDQVPVPEVPKLPKATGPAIPSLK
tara:strand:- start:149 stop:370 length:222 start_codon:yes stop_codon:yes gene_type:complete